MRDNIITSEDRDQFDFHNVPTHEQSTDESNDGQTRSSSDTTTDEEFVETYLNQLDIPVMSIDSIIAKQKQDHELFPIINYLSKGKLPKSQRKSRLVLRQQADYFIHGILFHSRVARAKRTQTLSHYQLVVPKSLIPTVLQLFHDSPLAGHSDAVTVSEALFTLFTTYGVCDTLISDQGTEFTAKVTSALCDLLDIPQQFTPSFIHHCLGACERTHNTLGVRLTPYMNDECNNWDTVLPAVTFSMNNSVHKSTGFSPFEVIFAQRPKFPLVNHTKDLKSLPVDMRDYVAQKQQLLNDIRTDLHANVQKPNIIC
ncbi:uncharacterized protein [Argopecten irradians]|uniref:uncharacterized protein n=1 Tax=Argopecten irradians TaxID=31199 RepID=UPI003710BC64